MGVTNIITFDAHDPRVQNAIPMNGFETIMPTYQFMKTLLETEDLTIDPEHMMVISPDEGGMKRTVAEMTLLKMSDTTLDTSSDAILSRLSKLETAVLSGMPMMATAEPVVQPQKVQTKQEDAPIPAPIAEAPNKQAQEPKPPMPTEDTLRVLRGWNEMAERAASGDIAILAFMRQGRAFTDGEGKVHIRFPNDFAKGMVDRSPHKENIRGVLRATLGREIAESDLIFGILDGKEQDETDLDGLEI